MSVDINVKRIRDFGADKQCVVCGKRIVDGQNMVKDGDTYRHDGCYVKWSAERIDSLEQQVQELETRVSTLTDLLVKSGVPMDGMDI